MLAPNQTGMGPHGIADYGHSLIVSPWGEVLADGGEDTGFIMADINTEQPSTQNRLEMLSEALASGAAGKRLLA